MSPLSKGEAAQRQGVRRLATVGLVGSSSPDPLFASLTSPSGEGDKLTSLQKRNRLFAFEKIEQRAQRLATFA